jgi:tRNA-specific 2-thiouridylase
MYRASPVKPKVVVAMSGGVDSSLAAYLLKKKGYDVFGITMKLWDYKDVGGDLHKDGRCCSLEAMSDARHICSQIDVPHYVWDFTSEFQEKVIQNFIDEYQRGKTPNPCIVCNTEIKWKVLWDKAKKLGADFIATGHYARIEYDDDEKRYLLLKGKDQAKDQSYALWGLSQENLSKTIFPLGDLNKKETRELSLEFGLKTAFKEESQEICFIPDDDYGRFLRERGSAEGGSPAKCGGKGQGARGKEGPICNLKGEKIGTHPGICFYTIGQRRGLNIALGKPIYVVKIDPDKNAIYMGEDKDLFKSFFVVSNVNWIAIPELEEELECEIKIRYLHQPTRGKISKLTKEKILIKFQKPERAITPGQSAVFYQGEKVIGGGIIDSVLD